MSSILTGRNNTIYKTAIIGGKPQIVTRPLYKTGGVKIGDNNTFRDFVTVHCAESEGNFTEIGDNNYFMEHVHLGHDCKIGNNVILVNYAGLSGYVTVEDFAFISGYVGVQQRTRIGKCAFIASHSQIRRNVPSFVYVEGKDVIRGINKRGMERAGYTHEEIMKVYREYKDKGITKEMI